MLDIDGRFFAIREFDEFGALSTTQARYYDVITKYNVCVWGRAFFNYVLYVVWYKTLFSSQIVCIFAHAYP